MGGENDTASQSFFVHADLLTSRSKFFAKVLVGYEAQNTSTTATDEVIKHGVWREGQERVVKLPVDEPEVFSLYVQLLYLGRLPIFEYIQRIDASNTKHSDQGS